MVNKNSKIILDLSLSEKELYKKIENSKKTKNLEFDIYFIITPKELNNKKGSVVLNVINQLSSMKLKFNIMTPFFPCMFDNFEYIQKKYKTPKNCLECKGKCFPNKNSDDSCPFLHELNFYYNDFNLKKTFVWIIVNFLQQNEFILKKCKRCIFFNKKCQGYPTLDIN